MSSLPEKYLDVLNDLKEKIRNARKVAVYTVNTQLLSIYWEIGNTVLEQQKHEGWGTKVIDRLSHDLTSEFPDMSGLSVRNIKYMRAFAEAYPNFNHLINNRSQSHGIVQAPLAQLPKDQNNQIVQANLAQLSWYHHITLLDKVKDPAIRNFYILQTIENGWSRNVMVHQIESGLHNRQGQIISNFRNTIPTENSELVQQVFKDPYKFEFIYLGKEAKERDLEDALTNQLTKFLIELGRWFAFMGRQYKIYLGDKEYKFDLLFYHTRLKRYIVIDLKIDEFKPEYKGKMDYYLTLADEHLKDKNDAPSIGLILCKTRDGLVAEYALRDSTKPIGIAEYKLSEKLPKEIQGELPTIEELELKLESELEKIQKPLDKKLSKLKYLVTGLNNEDLKYKHSPERTEIIYKKLLLPLKKNISHSLRKDINPLFKSVECFIWVDHQGHPTEKEATEILSGQIGFQCHILKLEYRLLGFKKAGISAFDIWKTFKIDLGNYSYKCLIENPDLIITEKLYHQLPDKNGLKSLTEQFCESIVDYINLRIEQIKNNEK